MAPSVQLLWQSQVPTWCYWRRWQAICQRGEQTSQPGLSESDAELTASSSSRLRLGQLLNRNPKHRLGASRDAAELKEHAFFKSIDWEALGARQIPPPFKPYVDSDESVANFDPEFTEADLFEEAPRDVMFDEDDPSADWLDATRRAGGTNGGANGGGGASNAADSEAAPMAIKPRRPAPLPLGEALTNSVQENFREWARP